MSQQDMERYLEWMERTTKNIRCSCCKRPFDFQDPCWRWNGRQWEHSCPENHPQAGHQPSEVIPYEHI